MCVEVYILAHLSWTGISYHSKIKSIPKTIQTTHDVEFSVSGQNSWRLHWNGIISAFFVRTKILYFFHLKKAYICSTLFISSLQIVAIRWFMNRRMSGFVASRTRNYIVVSFWKFVTIKQHALLSLILFGLIIKSA